MFSPFSSFSGQLLISQGSLVYAQQGNNLMAVPSHQLMASQLAQQQATTASVSLQQVEPPKVIKLTTLCDRAKQHLDSHKDALISSLRQRLKLCQHMNVAGSYLHGQPL